MNIDERRTIICGTHGEVDYGLVCCHLFARSQQPDGTPLTFYVGESEDTDSEGTDSTCIWCSECDKVLQLEGDWNDASEAFANPSVVCEFCLTKIMESNVRGSDL
jgi:hypothetical protein